MNSSNQNKYANPTNLWYHQFNSLAKKMLAQKYPQSSLNNSYLQKHRLRKLMMQIQDNPKMLYDQHLKMNPKHMSEQKPPKKLFMKQNNKKQQSFRHQNLYFRQRDSHKQKNNTHRIFTHHKTQKIQQQFNTQNHKYLDIKQPISPGKKKLHIFNKSKQLNYPINDNHKWYKQIHTLFGKIFENENGCNCQQPCAFSIFLIQWSQTAKFYKYDLYGTLKEMTPNKTILNQINKDIVRTQPNLLFFQNKKVLDIFSKILIAYSVYDKDLEYVQGMNFILATLLYHIKDEQKCFYVFFKLMKQQRNLYLNNFSQTYRHINIIKQYIKVHIYDLHHHFVVLFLMQLLLDINIENFLLPWILSILTILVNIQYMHLIMKQFIIQGWKFIYGVIVTYLLYLKQQILREQDTSEIFVLLSVSGAHKRNILWDEIIQNSKMLKLFE